MIQLLAGSLMVSPSTSYLPQSQKLNKTVFVRDLLRDPAARDASDVSHTVVAVSSSSSASRAEKFISETGIPSPCAAYGSYEDLVADPNVDVVYVATPHSHHFQNVMLALEAGKNVLCEKAFTVNAAQTRILVGGRLDAVFPA
jgi:predicted dehydrogenase